MWFQLSDEQREAIMGALVEAEESNRHSSQPDHDQGFYVTLMESLQAQAERQDPAHIIYTIAQQQDQGDRKMFWEVMQITEQAENQFRREMAGHD